MIRVSASTFLAVVVVVGCVHTNDRSGLHARQVNSALVEPPSFDLHGHNDADRISQDLERAKRLLRILEENYEMLLRVLDDCERSQTDNPWEELCFEIAAERPLLERSFASLRAHINELESELRDQRPLSERMAALDKRTRDLEWDLWKTHVRVFLLFDINVSH